MPLLSPAMQSKSTARGKVITQLIIWDTSDADGIVFDFTAQGNAMLLREPVCVFVDNTRGTGQITMSVEGYAYQLVIQPGMIASLPLFAVALPRVTVKCSEGAGGITSVVFCDFMLPNFAFEATGVSQTTTDTILQEVVSGGPGSESLRVVDSASEAALGEILAQLKETLSVSDADVLAQLKETLSVSDADVLAQLKETLSVTGTNYTTATSYTFGGNSGFAILSGENYISSITVIPVSDDAENLVYNFVNYPTNANAPSSTLVACLLGGAANSPVTKSFSPPLRVTDGLSMIAATLPWNGTHYINMTSCVVIIETSNVGA